MKNVRIISLILIFVLGLCLKANSAVKQETLYHLVKTGRIVKVWIGEFTNSTENEEISLQNFTAALKSALRGRKSANFILVESAQNADISISGDVEEYVYQEVDPIDMALGIGGLAADAMVKENYVALKVAYIVEDAKKGKVIWSRTLRPSITKPDMPEEECLPLVLTQAGRQFVSQCFKRPPKRR